MPFLLFMLLTATGPLPADGGPVYQETDTSRWIVEPWNAISSLFILLPAVYWAIKLRGKFREYPFIAFCIPLLFLGGLGSTLYHAFRSSRLLLLLDVTPTAILTIALAVYFWAKVLPRWWWALLIVGGSLLLRVWLWNLLPSQAGVNASYAISGSIIFIPTLLLLYQTRLASSQYIFISVLFFSLSLLFRYSDVWELPLLPMGTHFLWHICSGIGAFFLAEYLYKVHLDDRDLHIKS
jgi:hypothetical protein